MREVCEFRVLEEFFPLVFPGSEGQRISDSVRKVEVSTSDPLFQKVGAVQRQLKADAGKFFFAGWKLKRTYAKEELAAARAFLLSITAIFEPAGEECKTVYDESAACPQCGAGASQVSDLRLDSRRIPKQKDIASTIANEWIVSQKLASILVQNEISGFRLAPLRHHADYSNEPLELARVPSGKALLHKARQLGIDPDSWRFFVWLNEPEQDSLVQGAVAESAQSLQTGRRLQTATGWYQLIVESKPLRVAPMTRFGINPFDDDAAGTYRCPNGHVLGLNRLSELYVEEADWDGADFHITREYVGTRRGLLRPTRLIVVSPKLRKLFLEHKIKGADFEVAHLVAVA